MAEEKDSESRIALLIIFALIALIVTGVLWFGANSVLKRNQGSMAQLASSPVVPAATVASAPRAEGPVGSVLATGTGATFLFAADSAALPEDSTLASQLAHLIALFKQGERATITPFNGVQGNDALSATDVLTQQRVQALNDLLVRLGAPVQSLIYAEARADRADQTDAVQAQRIELLMDSAVPVASVAGVGSVEGSILSPSPVGGSAATDSAVVGATTEGSMGAATPTDENDGPRVVVEDGLVKFYFAVGKADLAAGASEALLDVIAAVASGKRAVISGFTDASGSAALNEELSKQRAFAVRDTLLSLGVPEDRIELQKPEAYTGTGHAAEARRVEVRLAD